MNALTLSLRRPLEWAARGLRRLRWYWALLKSLQTALLVLTAVAGYATGCCTSFHSGSLAALVGSLLLAVGGVTVLNMVYDRDIDSCMERTCHRPLPSGQVSVGEALVLGLALTIAGLVWSFWLAVPYGWTVLTGVLLDGLVYTILLKRRTPYAVIIGGLSGGMPAIAGRVLATGQVDAAGILLALGVLLWIPTHILTFTIKRAADYRAAGVPTFPAAYGVPVTRRFIAFSTILAVTCLLAVGQVLGVSDAQHTGLALSGGLLCGLVLLSVILNRPICDFILYKGASVYMVITMLLLIWTGH
ncbi:MAG TPA: UbiA family prenyltransferase [Anaerolineaceae bacterium]